MRSESDTGSSGGPGSSPGRRHRVVLVAVPGAPLFEFGIAAEVFGIDRRDLSPDWYDFEIAGTHTPTTTIAHGLAVPVSRGLDAVAQADTVIVPACRDVHDTASPSLLTALAAAHERGTRIAAICSGSFVLAQAGLLDGRRVTTHWMHAAELTRRYPTVTVDADSLFVHDSVWTSAGSAAGVDMCLELVRQDLGVAVANEVARRMVAPPHRDGGQAQFIPPAAPADATASGAAGRVQHWVRANLSEATVSGMAAHAGISTRTLHRRFAERVGHPPQVWLQRQRLNAAAELLETTELTVEAIARRVGLGTAANLRERFGETYGVSPGRYRTTFGHDGRAAAHATSGSVTEG